MGLGHDKLGPIQFNKKGKSIVRFHLKECCRAPHGHAAVSAEAFVITPLEK